MASSTCPTPHPLQGKRHNDAVDGLEDDGKREPLDALEVFGEEHTDRLRCSHLALPPFSLPHSFAHPPHSCPVCR